MKIRGEGNPTNRSKQLIEAKEPKKKRITLLLIVFSEWGSRRRCCQDHLKFCSHENQGERESHCNSGEVEKARQREK